MYNHTAAFAHKGAQVTAGPALSMHPSIMSASSPRLAFCGGRGVGEAMRIRGALPATPPNTIAQLINRISYLPQAGFYVPGSYILCSNIFLCDETQLASSVNEFQMDLLLPKQGLPALLYDKFQVSLPDSSNSARMFIS